MVRWKTPDVGEIRIRRGFLFIPRCIDGEWRWLEHAVWAEKYEQYYDECGWGLLKWM